jgi:hypothetical protein
MPRISAAIARDGIEETEAIGTGVTGIVEIAIVATEEVSEGLVGPQVVLVVASVHRALAVDLRVLEADPRDSVVALRVLVDLREDSVVDP